MPRRITADEAKRMGLVEGQPAGVKRITAEQAARMGLVEGPPQDVSPVPGIAKSVVDSATRDADGNYVAKTSDGQTIRFTPKGEMILAPDEAVNAMRGIGPTFTEGALERGLSATHGAANSLTNKVAGVWEAVKNQPQVLAAGPVAAMSMGAGLPLLGLDPKRALDDYDRGQRNAEKTTGPAIAAHPYANVVGALMMPTPGPGKAAVGAKFLTRALAHAPVGAATATLNAFGNTTANDSATGAATSTAASGLVGGGLGAGLEKAGGALAKSLEERSAVNALKASGLRPGINTKLKQLGVETADDAVELGRKLRESGWVAPGGTPSDVSRAVAQALPTEGANQAKLLEAIDAAATKRGEHFNAHRAASNARDAIEPEFGRSPAFETHAGPARTMIEQIQGAAPGPGVIGSGDDSFRAANALRQQLGEGVNWAAPGMGLSAELPVNLQRKVYGSLRESILKQASEKASPELAADLSKTNARIALAKDTMKLATDNDLREMARKSIGLSKTLSLLGAGGAGASAVGGSPEMALGLAAASGLNALIAPRIPSAMMAAQYGMSKVTPVVADALAPYASSLGGRKMAALIRSILATDAMPEEKRAALATALQGRAE
jgi:hypothetical protein